MDTSENKNNQQQNIIINANRRLDLAVKLRNNHIITVNPCFSRPPPMNPERLFLILLQIIR